MAKEPTTISEHIIALYGHIKGLKSEVFNIKRNNFDINLSGLSGTELSRLSYHKHFKNHQSLALNDLLKEYVELVDVLKDEVFDKKSYIPHLYEYYSKNLKGI